MEEGFFNITTIMGAPDDKIFVASDG